MSVTISSQKLLEDLNWVLTSPSLLKQSTNTPYSIIDSLPASPFIAGLPPSKLEQFTEQLKQSKSHFLGPYFEYLWQLYLEESERYDLIAHNLQINNNGKTIGEFDAIVFDHETKQHLHQELAIKFYLGCNDSKKPLWIGPQAVDRLDIKMDRLLSHQLQLSKHPAAQKRLTDLGISKLSPQIIMKGMLFQPVYKDRVSIPPYVNPQHSTGHWISINELSRYLETYENDLWLPLSKLEWIETKHLDKTNRSSHVMSNALFKTHIKELVTHAEIFRPIMCSQLRQAEGAYLERCKLFIVDTTWPTLAKTSPAL